MFVHPFKNDVFPTGCFFHFLLLFSFSLPLEWLVRVFHLFYIFIQYKFSSDPRPSWSTFCYLGFSSWFPVYKFTFFHNLLLHFRTHLPGLSFPLSFTIFFTFAFLFSLQIWSRVIINMYWWALSLNINENSRKKPWKYSTTA